MSCDGNNATPPSPAIAPASNGAPAAADLDPRQIAEDLVTRHGGGGINPRVTALVPGFDAPFYQAGLAGYSDAAMRIIARRHGCPFCVTEALLDRTLLAGGRGFAKADLGEIEDNIPGGDEDRPLAGQIMGSDPAEMAAAAIKMVEQGQRRPAEYRDLVTTDTDRHARSVPMPNAQSPMPSFATIDINLACPVKKIAKKARGGHWLAAPEGAIAILEAVREAIPPEIQITVKMRRSFDDTPEMAENFDRIFDAAYDIGCAWVTVHARTVQQKYLGPSRWDLLRDIIARKGQGRIVFGSGDIWHAEDVFRMIAYTGVTGVSIARGCIGNPWIFRQCRDMLAGRPPRQPTIAEQRAVLLEHFELAMRVNHLFTRGIGEDKDERAERHTARTMRKFGVRFAEHHPQTDAVRKRFITAKTMDDWRGVLADYYIAESTNAE